MRERWEQVQREFSASIRSPRVVQIYLELARREDRLARFDTPRSLADHLAELRRDPAGNALYLTIVDVFRTGPALRTNVAGCVLWLGLWPLLNWIYTRQVAFWHGCESDLTSEIGRCLTTVLRGTDLTRVESVALTIARDTERDLVERRQAELAEEVDWSPALALWQEATPSEGARLHEIADGLRILLGDDFELALAAYESRCDYELLGRQFGLEEEEIRRRIRRAWRRVRKEVQKNRPELQRSVGISGIRRHLG